jgi:hypothetical protein
VLIVMPRSFSSGAESMSAYAFAVAPPALARTVVIAACQARLAVVDVTDRPDVHVRLLTQEFLLTH